MSLLASLNDLLESTSNLFGILLITTALVLLLTYHRHQRSRPRTLPGFESLGLLTPLPTFSWTKEAPRKWRPFKPIYNLTMALRKCTLNDLISIDLNHHARITERRRLHKELGQKAVNILPSTHPCLALAEQGTKEFYELLSAYLPVRYPTIFTPLRMYGAFWKPWQLHSAISCPATSFADFDTRHLSDDIPVDAPVYPLLCLENISRTLDEDFLILVPAEDGDGYIMGAYIACFPQGFDTSTLLGKRVRDIHGPVPQYREKLQGSMERYFERLECGKFVRRVNWSVVTSDRLYTGDVQTHFHKDEVRQEEEFDVAHTFQRSEAQILFRLPRTGALVFVIKTYLYTLEEIRDEGLGNEFADAIEGLGKGNVPEIYTYKRGPVWAEKVKTFLRRGETEKEGGGVQGV